MTWAVLTVLLSAADAPPKLGVFVAGGYLGSSAGHGGALSTGVGARLGEHFTVGFDVGYGLLNQQPGLQDRWWLMPTLAGGLRIGLVRFDAGVGAGAGTASAFTSATMLSKDKPSWAFQLMPAVRGHFRASTPLTERLDLFARVDGGLLVMSGPFGMREGGHTPSLSDSTWANFWFGMQVHLL